MSDDLNTEELYDSENNPMMRIAVWIPKENYKRLIDMEPIKGLPLSRLIQIAVDNEFDQSEPFNYPLDWASLPEYREYAYAKEAARMLDFLSRLTYGLGVEHIILCRRQYGIEDRETAMLAYRELKCSGMIEEYWPRRSKFNYPPSYRYTRVVKQLRKTLGNRRFKRFEDEKRYTKRGWKRKGEGE